MWDTKRWHKVLWSLWYEELIGVGAEATGKCAQSALYSCMKFSIGKFKKKIPVE